MLLANASSLVPGEHMGYVGISLCLPAIDISERWTVGVFNFVATWHLLNGGGKRLIG